MAVDAAHRLAGTFNFRVSLRKSAAAESGQGGTAAAPGISAGISVGISVGISAGTSAGGETLGDGGFQECSGLEIEMDVQELQEGGRNNGVIRRVGRGKYSNLVLKRGMFYGTDNRVNTALWAWLQGVLNGVRPVVRYDGTIQVLGFDGATVLATWTFTRGLPAKVSGPQLNAKTGDVAIEELTIAHEGLQLAL